MVYIPTAGSDEELEAQRIKGRGEDYFAEFFGVSKVSFLHPNDWDEADTEDFVRPLGESNAVFIEGGRHWRLADSYLDSKTHQELLNLLDRGGVIAGTSAGATIQGSFMVRGNSDADDPNIVIGDHQEGFAFIANIAIDQHIRAREREAELAQVLELHPELLGIGIDEDTAVHVQGDRFDVLGAGHVFVHDGHIPYYLLNPGEVYDMKRRAVVSPVAL